MRTSSILTAIATATTASARIIGIAVPQTIKAGDVFTTKILTENYIQTVADIAIAFGVSPGSGYPGSLGTELGSFYLGPDQSNIVTNITEELTMPAGEGAGAATVSAALFSLYGASHGGVISNYNVSVTIGDETSETYVSSMGRVGS